MGLGGAFVLASYALVSAPELPALGFRTKRMPPIAVRLWLKELPHVCQCGARVPASYACFVYTRDHPAL